MRRNWNFYERAGFVGKIIGYIAMIAIGIGLGRLLNYFLKLYVGN